MPDNKVYVDGTKPDLEKWEPVALTFNYKIQSWREPCCLPCCLCSIGTLCNWCYTPKTCCMSQKDKVERVHRKIFKQYARDNIVGAGSISLHFVMEPWEEKDGMTTYRFTEIFRNVDAAEAYYDYFMGKGISSGLCCTVFTNINPLMRCFSRQVAGPGAGFDGNVKIYGNTESIKRCPQLVKFNHAKLDNNPAGDIEVVHWETPPTAAELQAMPEFGAFHFGLRWEQTVAPTEGGGGGAPAVDMER